MPVATLRRYFYAEEREPTVDAVVAVAGALGLSASEIFARAEREVIPEQAPIPVVKRVTAREVRSIAHQRRSGD